VSGQNELWTIPNAMPNALVVSLWLLCGVACIAFWAVAIVVITRL
jgi:hypothetical protein